MKLRNTMKPIFEQPAYSLELVERMLGKIPCIKLKCRVCGCLPATHKEVLYINDLGVCKLCMDKDANYEGGVNKW